ncbi:MAG: crossover junction endodeoxyribonuclease RuvC [Ignavibacteriaceae bacterium]
MRTKTLNILSIIPGTKYLGVAVFIDTDLRDWFVKSITAASVNEKAEYVRLLMSDFIERFGINVLAIKKLHPARSSKNLSDLASEIKEIGKEMNVKVIELPIQSVEHSLLNGKPNKKRLTEEVAALYPIVFHEYEREKKNKSRYLTRMFEAIALGIVSYYRMDNEHQKVDLQHQ